MPASGWARALDIAAAGRPPGGTDPAGEPFAGATSSAGLLGRHLPRCKPCLQRSRAFRQIEVIPLQRGRIAGTARGQEKLNRLTSLPHRSSDIADLRGGKVLSEGRHTGNKLLQSGCPCVSPGKL